MNRKHYQTVAAFRTAEPLHNFYQSLAITCKIGNECYALIIMYAHFVLKRIVFLCNFVCLAKYHLMSVKYIVILTVFGTLMLITDITVLYISSLPYHTFKAVNRTVKFHAFKTKQILFQKQIRAYRQLTLSLGGFYISKKSGVTKHVYSVSRGTISMLLTLK